MCFPQVRQNTVICLREIADYMDAIGHKTGVAKVSNFRSGESTTGPILRSWALGAVCWPEVSPSPEGS